MSLTSEDCVYSASGGAESEQTFRGHEAVRRGVNAMLAFDTDSVATVHNIHV